MDNGTGAHDHGIDIVTLTLAPVCTAQADQTSPVEIHRPEAVRHPLLKVKAMSYDHHGPANIIIASRRLGVHSDECLNEAVDIQLTLGPTTAHMRFSQPLDWPANPNYVTVLLPDGSLTGGVIVEHQRPTDGPGWLTFTVDE